MLGSEVVEKLQELTDKMAKLEAQSKQVDIAIEAFLVMADAPFFQGNGIRLAAEKIRELRAHPAPAINDMDRK